MRWSWKMKNYFFHSLSLVLRRTTTRHTAIIIVTSLRNIKKMPARCQKEERNSLNQLFEFEPLFVGGRLPCVVVGGGKSELAWSQKVDVQYLTVYFSSLAEKKRRKFFFAMFCVCFSLIHCRWELRTPLMTSCESPPHKLAANEKSNKRKTPH